jgi:hypothetical protein
MISEDEGSMGRLAWEEIIGILCSALQTGVWLHTCCNYSKDTRKGQDTLMHETHT